MAGKTVVLAFFKDEATADDAVKSLKAWDKSDKSFQLDAIGVLALDDKGKIKTHKLGKRSVGKGAGIGLVLAVIAPPTLLAGVIGGGLLGAFHHKGLGLRAADRDRIRQLSAGEAAVGMLVNPAMAIDVSAKLSDLGGRAEVHEVTEEAVAEVETAVPAVEAAEIAAGDDLSILDGVGPKYADALKAKGITTFAQLSTMSPEAIEETLIKANTPLIAGHNAHTWPRQAKLAANQDWSALRRYIDSTKARRPLTRPAGTAGTPLIETPPTIQVGGVSFRSGSGEADARFAGADAPDPPAFDAGRLEGRFERIDTIRGNRGEKAARGLGIVGDRHEIRGHVRADLERGSDESAVVGGAAGLDARRGELAGTGQDGQGGRVEDEAGAGAASHLEPVSEQAEPGHVRGGRDAVATSASAAARLRRRIAVDGGREVRLARLALSRARDEDAGPEPLGEHEPIARPRAALAQELVRVGGTDDRQPVLGLRVADRVPAGERAARLAHLGGGAGEDLGHHVPRQLLGERRDRQREEHPAAHRKDVGQRVGRGDLAEGPRVVDQRREEIERADDREVVADTVDRGVVGRLEPGEQRGVGRRGGLGARVRPVPLRGGRLPAWRRSRRNRSGRSGGRGAASSVVMRLMIGLPSRRERSGPGGSPGLQNQWRGARRGAVGSTPTRSRHGTRSDHGGLMSTERPRPPSVERVLAAVRPRIAEEVAPDAVAAVARDVVDGERERRRGRRGSVGRSIVGGGRRRTARWLRGPLGSGLTSVLNATGVVLHTNLGRARAQGRDRGRCTQRPPIRARVRP